MKNLFKALASFQQEVPAIHEGTKGYGYTYSDLTTIFKVINPIMKKHNLGFTQLLEGAAIKTIVFHTESGETLETVTEIPKDVQLKQMNAYQAAGSSYTYFRRYSLSAILGLVTDVDSDAKGEQINEKKLVQMDITEATTKLNNADDLDELETAWKLLTREEKKDKRLIKLTNDLKVEFLKQKI
jgi:hypothetical protein